MSPEVPFSAVLVPPLSTDHQQQEPTTSSLPNKLVLVVLGLTAIVTSWVLKCNVKLTSLAAAQHQSLPQSMNDYQMYFYRYSTTLPSSSARLVLRCWTFPFFLHDPLIEAMGS